MKADIHPAYHEITVVMTDGTEFKTRSTWGEPGAVLRLETDPSSHPAWNGGESRVMNSNKVTKFSDKFGAFGLKI